MQGLSRFVPWRGFRASASRFPPSATAIPFLEREAIAAGRLTALRSLDLADCVGSSAELLEEIGAGTRGRRSLGCDRWTSLDFEASAHSFASPRPSSACTPSSRSSSSGRGTRSRQPRPPRSAVAEAAAPPCGPRLHEFASTRLENLEPASESHRHLLESLRWAGLAPATKLRSLSLGRHSSAFCDLYPKAREFLPPAECFAVVPRLPALELLSIRLSSSDRPP
eukprot:tig00000248_g21817.t1